MRTQGLTYEDHQVGARYETLARTVSEADICAYVNLCGFNEPLFYDMEYVARESVADGAVKPILERHALPTQEIHAVYPSPKLVPGKVSAFIEHLRGALEGSWWERGA